VYSATKYTNYRLTGLNECLALREINRSHDITDFIYNVVNWNRMEFTTQKRIGKKINGCNIFLLEL
jgi:hypothetical protein